VADLEFSACFGGDAPGEMKRPRAGHPTPPAKTGALANETAAKKFDAKKTRQTT
jgi:hypothetical protein